MHDAAIIAARRDGDDARAIGDGAAHKHLVSAAGKATQQGQAQDAAAVSVALQDVLNILTNFNQFTDVVRWQRPVPRHVHHVGRSTGPAPPLRSTAPA